jgi:3-mercaptopyruvate sulfurtransferase SseA
LLQGSSIHEKWENEWIKGVIMKFGVLFTLLAGLLLASSIPGYSVARTAKVSKSESTSRIEEADVAYPEVPRIAAEELKRLMDKKSEYVLVDTRDSEKYDQGHIKGAVNIYYNPIGDPVAREMMLLALPMDQFIIIYCS